MKATLEQLETAKPPDSTKGDARLRTVGITVLFHPDTRRVGEVAPLVDLHSGHSAELSRLKPVLYDATGEPTGPLGTSYLSRVPLLCEAPTTGGIRLTALDGSSSAVLDGVALRSPHEVPSSALDAGLVLELGGIIVVLLHTVPPPAADTSDLGLIGDSVAMRRLRSDIRKVASVDVPILLRGETGVGKELVARAIHDGSRRKERRYVCVNMAATPPAMAASLLFGHRRGAFTGAVSDHDGYFLQADGGTLFLDEIGDTPREVQPLLLRATEGEVQVLGEQRSRRVDARLIAATDVDLEQAVREGDFRGQLQERLAGFELVVPPLRARRDDVARLLFHFLRQELAALDRIDLLEAPETGKLPWMRPALVARLVRHSWPRNVRQLRNIARQIAIANHDRSRVQDDARLEDLFASSRDPAPLVEVGGERSPGAEGKVPAAQISDDAIISTLRENAYNISATAAALGASRTWLFTRMDASPRIRKARDLTSNEIEDVRAACHGDLKAAAMHLEVSVHGLKQRMTELGLS